MSNEIVRWQDTPRLYLVEASEPKRDGIPAKRGWLDIGRLHSVKVMDDAGKDYAHRVGYSIVSMFPHTHPPKPVKPKAAKKVVKRASKKSQTKAQA